MKIKYLDTLIRFWNDPLNKEDKFFQGEIQIARSELTDKLAELRKKYCRGIILDLNETVSTNSLSHKILDTWGFSG